MTLRQFIGQLGAAYERLRAAGGPAIDRNEFDRHEQSLLLAEAALRHAAPPHTARPAQIAVLGPTQTGKSSVVNLLVGQRRAQVSPLAGFTIHAQGIWRAPPDADAAWAEALFPGAERRPPGGLDRDVLNAYSLESIAPRTAAPADSLFDQAAGDAQSVVWDTPDFDSLAARRYARAVLEVAGLADAYVLVLSKEKYADLSVWHFLDLVAPLHRALLVVLNKTTPDSEEVIERSLRQRLAQHGAAWGAVPVVPLPHDPLLARTEGPLPAAPQATIQEAIATLAESAEAARSRYATGLKALIQAHWDAWSAPVRAEREARAQWQRMVETAAASFMEAYERDYLNHPQRYDSFRRASVALLDLLELPTVGGLIARTRQVLTWPARQVLGVGRSLWSDRRKRPGTVHSLGVEASVLVDTMETLLAGLQRDVVRRCTPGTPGAPVWQALERRLEGEQGTLREAFERAIRAHHEQVQQEVQRAANELYEHLRRSPARLNTLRTARASIDLGYMLLAVKTGGLTPMDAVWAPAAFAVTSLLLEGATGLEMSRVDRGLKSRQRAAVEQQLVRETLEARLAGLADQLDGPGLLGVSAEQLQEAEAALQQWEPDHA